MQQNICGANSVKYTIGKGQTLYAIAQQYNTTVQAILDANPGLDVQLYYAGDVTASRRGADRVRKRAVSAERRIRSAGETAFNLIAQRFDIPLADLLAAKPGG